MEKELAMVVAYPFPVRVKTNNRLHLRYSVNERTVDDGRCNIDENWVTVSASELEMADPARLCQFCFPREADDKEHG